MPLWLDAFLIIVLALLFDRFVGEPPNPIHPLRWMGNILDAINRRVKNRTSFSATVIGFLSYLFVFVLFTSVGMLLTTFAGYVFGRFVDPLAGEIAWIVATAFLFKITFAVFSFRHHCDPIADDLEAGRTEDAADKVQMIVSRNTKGMDADHIASSCCETISENLVDSVYSPVFFFGLFGLPGAIMFRCANLMDAMWGYLNEKYARIGYFPAKFDDVLGFITARISPYFIALAAMLKGLDWRAAISTAKEQHGLTPSPNSGYSMTAVAGAMGISMVKDGVYVMGHGPMPTPSDVRRCSRFVELASVVFIVTVSFILYALVGIHIQLYCEGWFLAIWEALF